MAKNKCFSDRVATGRRAEKLRGYAANLCGEVLCKKPMGKPDA
jgi:hypothetical protein